MPVQCCNHRTSIWPDKTSATKITRQTKHNTHTYPRMHARMHIRTHTHAHTTILWLSGFCLGLPGWAGTRRNIHPLTPVMVINHLLSASSIYYDPWYHLCSIYAPKGTPPLHTPYISSPNCCLLFAAHAHTITTCFGVVPRLCHLNLVSVSTLNLELYPIA